MAIKGQSSRKDVKIEKRNDQRSRNISLYLKDVDYNFLMDELDKVNEELKKSELFSFPTVSLGQLIKARALNYNHICECHKLDKQVI